jgi:aspartate carbamoyltransferase catalytic subunit
MRMGTMHAYRVTREMMRDKARSDAIILHSLPPRRHATYWTDAFNGVMMRMALLAHVLGAVE